ncbi:Sugar diacid utilization regulator [Alteribacillus persepolensis]|uniref:Sugar diacid utilization regulator n=1 Tax=Alteribacillus persepolensis TaxID=568899 RepID=A0A1G8GXB5_9BACI|nr:V4R domain-containing protein [Alteribacillus persepolensis]SDH98979.1 Sugar diacid utilization regulator [Alteribacillus persepolensis]
MEQVFQPEEIKQYLPESGQILSTLRNHLLSVLGVNRARGFLLRYGWSCGENFANHIKHKDAYDSLSLEDLFRVGAHVHGSTADLDISVTDLHIDPVTKDYYSEGFWKYSQEAEQHIHHFGLSDEAVCFTLTGYAGGYVSCILGREVIFKEIECRGKGDPHCHWVAKPIEDWGEDIKEELAYYKEEHIGKELDNAVKRIEEQKTVFKQTLQISERLSNAVLHGSNLQELITLTEKEINRPVVLEDIYSLHFAASPSVQPHHISSSFIKNEWKHMVDSAAYQKKTMVLDIPNDQHQENKRLISPIFVRNKLFGFLSFIEQSKDFSELDYLTIERASSICGIQILNETTAFEHEQRVKEELLNGVLEGEFNNKDIIYRLSLMGYNIEQPQYVFVFQLNNNQHHTRRLDESFIDVKTACVEKIYKLIEEKNTACVIMTKLQQIIAVIPKAFTQHFVSEVNCGTWLINETFADKNDIDVKLGISTLCSRTHHLKKGVNEAEKVLNILAVSKNQGSVKSYHELGALGKFIGFDNFPELEQFAWELLGDIISYDKKYNADLAATLYHYVQSNGHLKNTAQTMQMSLGATRYRLNRLQDIGGVDLSTSDGFFDVHVAIQVLLLAGDLQIK